jgi:putative addiction module component (TIGR02574 family)
VTTLAEIKSAVDRLSPAQQEELLTRLDLKLQAHNGDEFPVREDHVRLLEERFAEYRKDPSQVSTWEEVKRRIRTRRAVAD